VEEITGGAALTFSNPGWEGLNAEIIRQTVERLPCLVRPPSNWRFVMDIRRRSISSPARSTLDRD
jgi:hypothetical protein